MGYDKPNFTVRLHSVPRRFDLATMMVVTLAYALLFAAFRLIRLPPIAMGVVAGFITCVGIGQALLFGGKKPRISSVLVGAVCTVGIYVYTALTIDASLLEFHVEILKIWIMVAIAGSVAGYVAGITVGSVFLASDLVREVNQRDKM